MQHLHNRRSAASMRPAQVNGHPALIPRQGVKVDTVLAVRFDDCPITCLYAARNPEKLSDMNQETLYAAESETNPTSRRCWRRPARFVSQC